MCVWVVAICCSQQRHDSIGFSLAREHIYKKTPVQSGRQPPNTLVKPSPATISKQHLRRKCIIVALTVEAGDDGEPLVMLEVGKDDDAKEIRCKYTLTDIGPKHFFYTSSSTETYSYERHQYAQLHNHRKLQPQVISPYPFWHR